MIEAWAKVSRTVMRLTFQSSGRGGKTPWRLVSLAARVLRPETLRRSFRGERFGALSALPLWHSGSDVIEKEQH